MSVSFPVSTSIVIYCVHVSFMKYLKNTFGEILY